MQLDNGLTVIIREDHSQPVASVQVWVKAGSVNENENTSGLSHFLEHLVFKGTELYPGQEISRRVETQGGVINAATSKEFTFFYIDTQKTGLKDAIRILADAMANITLPEDEIEKERPVVLEEIKRHDDNPGAVLYDIFSQAMFLKTPYKDRVLGSADVIENVSRKEIMNYYKTHYRPDNMFLAIVGDFDMEKTLELVKETFGKHEKGSSLPSPSLSEPMHDIKTIRITKKVEQAYLMGGFLGPVITSDEQFAADITGIILGGGRSSRLYRKIREDAQLVYSIGSSFWTQRGSGVMVFSAVFPKENEKPLIEAINKEVNLLLQSGPSDAEIERAKQVLTSQWHFGRETFHDQASLFAYWYMQNHPKMIDKYIEGLQKVTKKDVTDFLKKYYKPQGISVALIIPEASK